MARKESMLAMERNALRTQGMVAILFGILAVLWPGLTAVILVRLFAAFLLIDAVILLVNGFNAWQHTTKATMYVLLGLLQLVLGLFLFHRPDVALGTLIILLGIILIVRGTFSFLHAFALKVNNTSKVMHALMAALGIVVGVVILEQPVAGGVAFVWVLGFYALLTGAFLFAVSNEVDKAIPKTRRNAK